MSDVSREPELLAPDERGGDGPASRPRTLRQSILDVLTSGWSLVFIGLVFVVGLIGLWMLYVSRCVGPGH